jgi:hypothetical protein
MNLLLGVGAVLITILSNSPLIGLILVLVAKWRVFAVRPRYIWINLKSNLVDMIVGVSIVLLTYSSGNSFLPIHIILAAFYSIWLIILKPMSSEKANLMQSLIAVFLGISASVIMTSNSDSIALILLSFLVGYAASRHVLVQSDDRDYTLTTLICGLVFAETAWLCHAWNIIYTFGSTGIRIPQLTVILTIFAFAYNYARQIIIKKQQDYRFKDIALPVIYSAILILVIIIWFSKPIFNI